jgi:hypothetical protein
MKRTGSIAALFFLAAAAVAAQGMKVLELQVGYLSPKDTKAGAIFGANYGVSVDEKMDLSIGLSYFHKGYSKETEVAKSQTGAGSGINTVQQPLEYSTTLIPLMANVTVHFPFQQPWGFHAGGSLGYEFLFDTYTNHATNTSEKFRFSGFGWMLRAGMECAIGSRSFFNLEAFYNNCKVKGNKKVVQGIPTWDQVDVSGIGFRAGVRVLLY